MQHLHRFVFVAYVRGVCGTLRLFLALYILWCRLVKTITITILYFIFMVTCVMWCDALYSLAKIIIVLHLIFMVTCMVRCDI